MNIMVSNTSILHQSYHSPLSFLSCIFALGIVALLFLLGHTKFTTISRLFWIGNLALCTAGLFLIAFMHHIVGTIFSWFPNRSQNDHEIGDDRSPHHHDQDSLQQAPAQDIVALFHMVLMEVLDRVWEDLVTEEGPEQRPQAVALQVQALEALPPPLQYCKGGLDITSSCCGDRCTICLDDFVDGESCRVFACNHVFHSNCIDPWLKNHLTCPICRDSVVHV